jgi:hypothetical protein
MEFSGLTKDSPVPVGEPLRDEFLSEEDLDIRNLSESELITYWNLWLEQAQASNDLDQFSYSHGVFENASASSV